MHSKFFVPVFLFVLVCVSFPVLSEDSPLMKHCESIHLRSSEGWWVSIYDDGSGAYGFGEGLARIKVVKNTFSYERVYSVFATATYSVLENTEDPHMAISCSTDTARLSVEHTIAQDQLLLTELFRLAIENAHPPMNRFETRSHYHVESFLGANPWNISPHILINKANLAGAKTRN